VASPDHPHAVDHSQWELFVQGEDGRSDTSPCIDADLLTLYVPIPRV